MTSKIIKGARAGIICKAIQRLANVKIEFNNCKYKELFVDMMQHKNANCIFSEYLPHYIVLLCHFTYVYNTNDTKGCVTK